ncbi:MAG: hypothetical protein GY941_01120 [Planctomycetes bacterium]|nr:hypothetical protein [Planctomycetota bacterium]
MTTFKIKLKPILLLFITALFTLPGLADSGNSSLIGTYAISAGGQLTEFAKVEKNEELFSISLKQDGSWTAPVAVSPITKEALEQLINSTVSYTPVGFIGDNGFSILQVPEGSEIQGLESQTGYVLMTWMMPLELHKL